MRKFKTWSDLKAKVENEGLDYFLTEYASPSIIADDADAKCLAFKGLWIQVLPLLDRLESMVNDDASEVTP